ncbi:MAG: thiamine diphosphokinase [Actinomycetota bacterium]|nr:thiamine diphosphokinase [Actinomycetota bacterium]
MAWETTTGASGPVARHAVVLTGGDPVDPGLSRLLPSGAYVIAADAGLEQAGRLGVDVDLAVGDFDSVEALALASARAGGCRVERHPVAKEHTDFELALLAARIWGAERVLVVGGYGGRLDHLLANALVLAGASTAGMHVEALMGPARLTVVRPETVAELSGEAGQLVTLLALGGPAQGVKTHGLGYPLMDEDLHPGSTRGVSNHLLGTKATVGLRSGVLLVICPGELVDREAPERAGSRSERRISGSAAPEPPRAPER